MLDELQQFDDFAPDALEIRERVIAGGFETRTGPDGYPYTGISTLAVPHWHALIAQRVGAPVRVRLAIFRLNLQGELPHSWVHSDGLVSTWASVLYLNPPEQCAGGTAFWRHKWLGIDRMPPESELLANGAEHHKSFHLGMTYDWKRRELWEQTRVVPMQFNRFVTYPTSYFHSRWPFEGWGKGPTNGRLIWACFYDRLDDREEKMAA